MAARWTSPPTGSFTYNAFKMYRNYDGVHAKFGDCSVSTTGGDPDQVSPRVPSVRPTAHSRSCSISKDLNGADTPTTSH